MSRPISEGIFRDGQTLEGAKTSHVCRIPRRSAGTTAAVAAGAAGEQCRSSPASRPIAKSSHEANHTKPRLEGSKHSSALTTKSTLRSRSQDERSGGFSRPGSAKMARHSLPASPMPPPMSRSPTPLSRYRISTALDKKPKITKKAYENQIIHVETDSGKSQRERQRKDKLNAQETSSSQSVLLKMANSLSQESVASANELVAKLKSSLANKKSHFEKLKAELNGKQRKMKAVLAEMKSVQGRLATLGDGAVAAATAATLPEAEGADLTAADLTAADAAVQQLDIAVARARDREIEGALESLTMLPESLVCCCDAALRGHMDIVQWLDTLRTSENKGIGKHELWSRVEGFTRDHMLLSTTLDSTKGKFTEQLTKAVDILRRGWAEREVLVREAERLGVEVAELTSQNGDLHRQLLSADHPNYTRVERAKIQELEKKLTEERCKRTILRERLTRADALHGNATERIRALQEQLERSSSEVRMLQASMHQLQEKNLKMQLKFDGDLCELTESLKKNMSDFQEIAEAREQLEIEKNDLVKQRHQEEIGFKTSIDCMKSELIATVNKLCEAQKERDKAQEDSNKVGLELEQFANKIINLEKDNKELLEKIQETELRLVKSSENKEVVEKELKNTTRALENCELEVQELKKKVKSHEFAISELERSNQRNREIKESLNSELRLKESQIKEIKSELMSEKKSKGDYARDFKKKLTELEQELQESESKVELYENQFKSLKIVLGHQPQDKDEGSQDGFIVLRHLIATQRTMFDEANQQNDKLKEELHKMNAEIEQREQTISSQRETLEQHEKLLIKFKTDEEEQAKALEQLSKELETSIQNEFEISKKYATKSEEVDILLSYADKRKQEINYLEKNILTIEDKLCKTKFLKKNQDEKIAALERMLMESHVSIKRKDLPADNLDQFINVLEAEFGAPGFEAFGDLGDDFCRKESQLSRSKTGKRGLGRHRGEEGSDSSLGEVYNGLVKKVSPLFLKKFRGEPAYLHAANNAERNHDRDPSRHSSSVDHGWNGGGSGGGRPNNINVYHTLRTDIELTGEMGSGGCERTRSPPRQLLTRMPLVTLSPPPVRRSQRSLDKASYISSTF